MSGDPRREPASPPELAEAYVRRRAAGKLPRTGLVLGATTKTVGTLTTDKAVPPPLTRAQLKARRRPASAEREVDQRPAGELVSDKAGPEKSPPKGAGKRAGRRKSGG